MEKVRRSSIVILSTGFAFLRLLAYVTITSAEPPGSATGRQGLTLVN